QENVTGTLLAGKILELVVILNWYNTKAFRLKLTNMKCNAMDKTFSKFEKCRVKAESRDLQYFQVYIKYYQLPIKEVQTRFYFLKRANGYKPFLYDFTLKCCFTKHLNSVTSIVWRWFTTVSNLNHSCPLTVSRNNLTLNSFNLILKILKLKRCENRYLQQQLSVLPILNGDYALFVNFSTNNVSRITMEFYATIF
ncbi:hypothetical protein FF38_01521, partial [Lucilia cuprina]